MVESITNAPHSPPHPVSALQLLISNFFFHQQYYDATIFPLNNTALQTLREIICMWESDDHALALKDLSSIRIFQELKLVSCHV